MVERDLIVIVVVGKKVGVGNSGGIGRVDIFLS